MTRRRTKKKGLLLETTVQRDRIMGDFRQRGRIAGEIDQKELFTTSFVYREFANTILKDVGFVYASVQELEPLADVQVPLSNLLRFLGSRKGNFSFRSAVRIHLVIADIVDSFGQLQFSRQRLLDTLERLMEQYVEDFFEASLPSGKDVKIKCLKQLDEPGELDRLRSCKPFPPPPTFPARAAQLLESNKTSISLIETAIRASRRRHQESRLLKILERLKTPDGDYAFLSRLTPSTRGNWWLGDLIIALESHPTLAIYTTDGLFEIICPILGKECLLGKY